MSIYLLLESALRSLIMGTAVYAALRLFRIRQVNAQRTAWMLALVASLAMPALIALKIGPRFLPQTSASQSYERPVSAPRRIVRDPSPRPVDDQVSTQLARQRSLATPLLRKIPYSTLLYTAVAGFLFLRLVVGLILAHRLRRYATPIYVSYAPSLDVRVSPRITTPVTIASSILLPESSSQWAESTLRIVLAHERAHLRQADFYLQLLAAAHSAIFWFNPFSWWLQRELSSLGEAMSDLAAVEQAPSRAGYAEVLLAFATHSSYPLTGVAMARSSNLKLRVERLLNDRLFDQSAAGKQPLTVAAACVVVLAIAASTSTRRVQAAQSSSAPGASSGPSPSFASGPSSATGAGSSTGSGTSSSGPSSPVAQDQTTGTSFVQEAVPPTPPTPPAPASSAQTDSHSSTSIDIDSESHVHKNGFSYATNNHGDAFALVTGEGNDINFTGTWNDAFQRARANTKGDYIYTRHDGKAYILQDPALIARAKALYAPMQQLNRRQAELGAQQEALGAQQEAFARQIEAVKISTPDVKKQLANLDTALQQLKLLEDKPAVDTQALADLEGRMAEIQGRLGELQGKAGEEQGRFGEQQGALGEQQGKLGEQQGKIGEEQGEIAREAQRQLQPLIEQAIREGKAKPVE